MQTKYFFRTISHTRYILFYTVLFFLSSLSLHAQHKEKMDEREHAHDEVDLNEDSDRDRHGNLFAYYLSSHLGDKRVAPLDTLKIGWYRRAIVEGRTISSGYAGGTYASPYFSKSYFSPNSTTLLFPFYNPYFYLLRSGIEQKWFDTKVPYTSSSYAKSGGSSSEESNFHTLFSMNLGKELNLGGLFDYDYANGQYASSKSKNITYRIFANYEGDRYKAYASVGNTNIVHFESGGITEDKYITNPKEFTSGRRSFLPKDIPVKLQRTWNRNIFSEARFHHRYSLGITRKAPTETDSLKREFVPVTTIFNDFTYNRHRRRFVSQMSNITDIYKKQYLPKTEEAKFYPDEEHIAESYGGTVGIALEEGFHKWAKMGLAGYIRYQQDRYSLPPIIPEGEQNPQLTPYKTDESTTYVGARLSSTKGKRFTYYLSGDLGTVGAYAGNLSVDAEAQYAMSIANKRHVVRLFGELKNERTPLILRRFSSTFNRWENSFNPVQRLRLGGELSIPFTSTRIKANIETIQNPIYVGSEGVPAQLNDNFRAIGVELEQNLKLGPFHWDNMVEYQYLSNDKIYQYPSLMAYSNLYVQTVLAKVLTLQLGVDAYWHTAYKAPYYEPSTQLLVPQNDITIGGGDAVHMNAYVSAHLKRARFFLTYYNVGALFLDPKYFSLPHYPTYPPMLRLGVIVDFRN